MADRYVLDWERNEYGAVLVDTATGAEIVADCNCGAPEDATLGRNFEPLVALLNEQAIALTRVTAERDEMRAAARKRLDAGHSDTCGYALNSVYECSCGHSALATRLASEPGDG